MMENNNNLKELKELNEFLLNKFDDDELRKMVNNTKFQFFKQQNFKFYILLFFILNKTSFFEILKNFYLKLCIYDFFKHI